MTWRKIMVPLIAQSGAEALEQVSSASLHAGLGLGRLFEAHVEVCCLAAGLPEPRGALFAGVPGSAIELLTDEIDKRNAEGIRQARDLFDALVAQYQPERRDKPGPEFDFSAGVVEVSGLPSAVATDRARLSDIAVLATSAEAASPSYQRLVQGLLTESGRPLLVVPADHHQPLSLDRVALAWNGSLEAARAASLSMPLVERARAVTVLTLQEDGPFSPAAEVFAEYLLWHGIAAECVSLERDERPVGEALQTEALNVGAGLLVMGAYTRSRLSRVVLGGATGAILREPRLPVIMVD
jgi:nucleotide-binding universal stress UspA family protein